MDALPRKYLTEEEYLAIERAAQWKSEYYQGEMFAMAGGSEAHSLIAMNLGGGDTRGLTIEALPGV
ncbi:MAG: hypothetical protein UZ07_CHB004000812 [Chlorobi bacterium OLB7]|nr:MAG: hypothetical protein UZ07_CHB004000812 [Chlorobi bacterium OLB7]